MTERDNISESGFNTLTYIYIIREARGNKTSPTQEGSDAFVSRVKNRETI